MSKNNLVFAVGRSDAAVETRKSVAHIGHLGIPSYDYKDVSLPQSYFFGLSVNQRPITSTVGSRLSLPDRVSPEEPLFIARDIVKSFGYEGILNLESSKRYIPKNRSFNRLSEKEILAFYRYLIA